MIVLIDNYDSFTYNVYQYLRRLGREVQVFRNDTVSPAEIEALQPEQIVISPGPGRPENAGVSLEIILQFQGRIPILGICLGHQCIGSAFGAKVTAAAALYHGRESLVYHDGKGVFSGIRNPFQAIRYHSLAVERASVPNELEISAWTEEGEIMALRHKSYSIEGVQFHPESIGTECGLEILANFIDPRRKPSRIQGAIAKVCRADDLDEAEAEEVMNEIASGKASPAQVAGLLTALRLKGEAVSEISGFARAMRRKAVTVSQQQNQPLLDTCGTGGDDSGSFNISTCAALVAAGAGARVAKHGNRSITSRCGSADLLEALGVNISAPLQVMEKCLDQAGLAFLFAPRLHPAMKHAAGARLDIGIRTIFNLLGPLVNPAGAGRQLIGVSRPDMLSKMARALLNLGTERALLVHGREGLDEISLCGPSEMVEIRDGWLRSYNVHPDDFGLIPCRPQDLAGGNLRTNAEIVLGVLEGKTGPQRDVVLMNAAAAIYLCGLAADLPAGVQAARDSLDSGAARQKLEQLVSLSNQ